MPDPALHQRKQWLDRTRNEYHADRQAWSALALARAEWTCGEYASAIARFREARDWDPGRIDGHVSLIRALMMLGEHPAANEALAHALSQHPEQPVLAFHQAQLSISSDPESASRVLLPHCQSDLHCALLYDMLECLAKEESPAQRRYDDPRLSAYWDSFRWLHANRASARMVGTAAEVLAAGIDAAAIQGLILECGVYFGRSITLLANRVDQHVHGFDSFQGLPEAWNANEPAGSYSTEGELPVVPSNVSLHPGWFEESLPVFFREHDEAIRLLHVDCDLHSSTKTVLDNALPCLCPGSIIVFDDFLGYPNYQAHEYLAFHEFAEANRLAWSVVAGGPLCREVCIRIDGRDQA